MGLCVTVHLKLMISLMYLLDYCFVGVGGGVPVLPLVGRIIAIRFVGSDFVYCGLGCFGGFVLVGILDLYLY